MKPLEIILQIYRHFLKHRKEKVIPIDLRPPALVGTVQDDPFDGWIENFIKKKFNNQFEIFRSGKLMTPDIIIRYKKSGTIVSIEIKKLIQKPILRDVFIACKKRKSKPRTPAIPKIPQQSKTNDE